MLETDLRKTVYLGLGSNLGEREDLLHRALGALGLAGVTILRHSSIYETAPMMVVDQPWFLNMAAEAETDLFPLQLLQAIKGVERALGRKRGVPKGPRVIDIDILLYGKFVIETPELTVPHPGIAERRFVLEPLAELSPGLRHPVTKRTIHELLRAPEIRRQEIRIWKPGL